MRCFFEETVFDEVAFGPRNLGLSEEEVKERVKWALEAVGLKGFEDKNPFKLSGGEKQRLAIACILAMNPKYLVLDEPTTGLDERGVGALKNIIEELRKEGKSFVIVTHDMDLVLEVADKVLLLSNGEVQFYGDVFEFFELDLKRYKLEEPELVKICRGIGLKPVRSVEELLRGIGL
ncbi:MAG: energy-coupling factor transport system ATP-binding protein [Pyrococcus sp.]|nr:energy-coupling factor transport system ATP-binding protein [Pyrococcus sp.]